MNAKRLYLSLALSLMFALATGLVLAQGVTAPEATTPGRPDASLGTAFTYQGRLADPSGQPIDNTCGFQFTLWDDPDAGTQVGPLLNPTGVLVTGGLFTVQLDFGDIFDGTRCGSRSPSSVPATPVTPTSALASPSPPRPMPCTPSIVPPAPAGQPVPADPPAPRDRPAPKARPAQLAQPVPQASKAR